MAQQKQQQGLIQMLDAIHYSFSSRDNNDDASTHVFYYGKDYSKQEDIKPKYGTMKEEMLNNKYAPITEASWCQTLQKCTKMLKGNKRFSQRHQKFLQMLQDDNNDLQLKHLAALKIHTDFDLLSIEFIKTFKPPNNKDKERMQSFYHWRQTLKQVFEITSNIPSILEHQTNLFLGITTPMCMDQYQGM